MGQALMVQGIAYGILHVYSALIDDPVTCRHRSRTDALLLLRQVLKRKQALLPK